MSTSRDKNQSIDHHINDHLENIIPESYYHEMLEHYDAQAEVHALSSTALYPATPLQHTDQAQAARNEKNQFQPAAPAIQTTVTSTNHTLPIKKNKFSYFEVGPKRAYLHGNLNPAYATHVPNQLHFSWKLSQSDQPLNTQSSNIDEQPIQQPNKKSKPEIIDLTYVVSQKNKTHHTLEILDQQLSQLKSAIKNRKIIEIGEVCKQSPLKEWLCGKTINLGSGQEQHNQTVSFELIYLIFTAIISCLNQKENLCAKLAALMIWKNNENLRNYLHGKSITLPTMNETPITRQATSIEIFNFYKSAIDTRDLYLTLQIFTNNHLLHQHMQSLPLVDAFLFVKKLFDIFFYENSSPHLIWSTLDAFDNIKLSQLLLDDQIANSLYKKKPKKGEQLKKILSNWIEKNKNNKDDQIHSSSSSTSSTLTNYTLNTSPHFFSPGRKEEVSNAHKDLDDSLNFLSPNNRIEKDEELNNIVNLAYLEFFKEQADTANDLEKLPLPWKNNSP